MGRNRNNSVTQVVATCIEPRGLKIHIQQHAVDHATTHLPELRFDINDMTDNVENPDMIAESDTVADSVIYIKETDDRFEQKYYNVMAKIKSEFNDGIVTNAYTSDNRKGGIILWEKTTKKSK